MSLLRKARITLAIIIVASLVAASGATAQSLRRISGEAIDTSGRPIAGARVLLEPDSRTTVSEPDGRFEFAAVPVGLHRIVGNRIGYEPSAITIDVQDANVRVQLPFVPIPRVLDSVVIREKTSGLLVQIVVVDDHGAPVPDAEVEVYGSRSPARTDLAGRLRTVSPARGSLVFRVRKLGFAPAMKTLRVLAERADTVVIQRLAVVLQAAEIMERSGFGRDTFVYRDLSTRMRWRGALAGVISREELDAQGKLSLCDALQYTPTGARLGLSSSTTCGPVSVLVNGEQQTCTPLTAIHADQVEAVEYYPWGSEMSGSLKARITGGCGPVRDPPKNLQRSQLSKLPGSFVVWLRPAR